MTRSEHMAWSKARAIELLDAGKPTEDALTSMASDLGKHKETENHAGVKLGMMMLMGGYLGNRGKMREFILGFN